MLRRFHSLTGVIPTGLVMLVELWTHAKALAGPEAHRQALERLAAGWIWPVVIGLPMVFHAGYGLWLSLRARYTITRYPTSENWNYTLQRATGVVALCFIALHVSTFWLPLRLGEIHAAEAFTLLRANLSSTAYGVPFMGLGYALGLAACVFHLANGLRSFATRWGLVTSRTGRNRASVAAALFGLALMAAGTPVIVYLATGWRMIGDPINVDATGPACEAPTVSATPALRPSASPTTEAAP